VLEIEALKVQKIEQTKVLKDKPTINNYFLLYASTQSCLQPHTIATILSLEQWFCYYFQQTLVIQLASFFHASVVKQSKQKCYVSPVSLSNLSVLATLDGPKLEPSDCIKC
jgi:hypothetical protein